MGGSKVLSLLGSDVNSWFYSVLSVVGADILGPLESGVNSRFYSASSDWGSEILSPFTIPLRSIKYCQNKILYLSEDRGTVIKFTDVFWNR